MILVVCLNPALDITYHVPAVDWAGVNRPSSVRVRPGGKGLNVARTLHSLGVEVLVMGLTGGITGAAVSAALGALGVPADFVPVPAGGESRRTFAVVDGRSGDTALFNEPGPRVCEASFALFADRYVRALARCFAVVLSGSLPPGLPASSYATLISMATAAGVPAVLDAHGEALLRGAAAGPAIVKPNLAELEALAGRSLRSPLSSLAPLAPLSRDKSDISDLSDISDMRRADRGAVAAAAGQLMAAGAQAVVASLGAEGLLAATSEGTWLACPPAAVAGNATGAGDAVAAGLAHGLVLGRPWDERLRHAVALGTASAAAPVAGEFSLADYRNVLASVTVRSLLCRWLPFMRS